MPTENPHTLFSPRGMPGDTHGGTLRCGARQGSPPRGTISKTPFSRLCRTTRHFQARPKVIKTPFCPWAGLKTTLPDFLSDVAANGGRAVPLNVSGGFHSPFMESASARLHDVLETMDVKEPTVPVYANYTAEPYTKETAKELLTQQVAHPVRWQQTVEKMIEAGVDTFVEVGAGKTLCGLIKKTSRAVKVYNVEDAETLSAAVQAIRAEGENA